MRRKRRWALPLGLLVFLAPLVACGAEDETGSVSPTPPESSTGPVLVVTLDGLRADAVGAFGGPSGLTPALDALVEEADWAGTAVSPSSDGATALASLLTGLPPHLHGARPGRVAFAGEIETFAEALAARGYRTRAYLSSDWLKGAAGFLEGFEETHPYGAGRGAERALEEAADETPLVFVELDQPAPPYRLFRGLLPRLEALGDRVDPGELPERVGLGELDDAVRDGEPIPADEVATWWAMYALNVARADQRIGRLIEALRASGEWEDSTVIVTSLRGEELGDYGGVGSRGGLRRRLIEVPLVVKRPKRAGDLELPAPGSTVSTAGLWASLVRLAGGGRPPAVTPSWFEAPLEGAWSERWSNHGSFQVSWTGARRQVVFLPGEPERPDSAAWSRAWEWGRDGREDPLLDREELRTLHGQALRRWRSAGGITDSLRKLDPVLRATPSSRRRDSG